MVRGMFRLTTGGDLAKVLIALLLGGGIIAIVAAAMQIGTARTVLVGILGVGVFGVVLQSGMSVFNRYRQLASGKCPNPLCHGVVQESQMVAEDEVVCPTCKKRWPKLANMTFRATARG